MESKGRDRVAKELGWAEGTVTRRLERGRELLRLQLVKRGITLSAGALGAALVDKVAAAPVPALLAINTIKAATAVVASKASEGGLISAQALILAEDTMKSMLLIKAKLVLLALTVSVALGGPGWAGYKALTQNAQPAPVVMRQEKEVAKGKEAVLTDLYGDPLPSGAVARLGTVRFRHDGASHDLAFTPDGKILVETTSLAIHLWDAVTGKERYRLPFNSSINAGTMAVSPDGTILAVGERSIIAGKDPKVVFIDPGNGKIIRNILLPEEKISPPEKKVFPNNVPGQRETLIKEINNLCFSSDGKNLALSSTIFRQGNIAQSKIYVFDQVSGIIHTTLEVENSHFDVIAFSPNNKMLAAAVYQITNKKIKRGLQLQLWDITTKKLIGTIHEAAGAEGNVKSIAFSPNGKTLAFGVDKELLLFNPATKNMLVKADTDSIVGMAFTPNGKQLITNDSTGNVQVWDAATLKVLKHFYTNSQGSLTLSPDGKTIALNPKTKKVQLWDLVTEKRLLTVYQGHDARINYLTFSPNGMTLASAGANEGEFILWDIASRRPINIFPERAETLTFTPNGKRMAAVAMNKVHIWDVAAPKVSSEIAIFPIMPGVRSGIPTVNFSSDSRQLFTLDWTDPPKILGQPFAKMGNIKSFVRHWDLATGKQIEMWVLPEKTKLSNPIFKENFPVLASNGKTVFMETDMAQFKTKKNLTPTSSYLDIFDAETGKKRILRGPENEKGRLFIPSPDGRLLASAIDKTPRLDKPTIGIFQGFSGIRLWEVATGKETFLLKVQTNNWGSQFSEIVMAWSRDGSLLAAGDQQTDRPNNDVSLTVRLCVWNTATGTEVARFDDFPGKITTLAFSPDGKYLAAGLTDTTILLFDVSKIDPKIFPTQKKLAKNDLEARWIELAGDDATIAYMAIWTLGASSKDSVPFLESKLKLITATNPDKIQQWIAELSSDVFAVRQTATRELEKAAEQAQAAIRKALRGNPILETRRRLEQILNTIPDIPGSDTVRTIRAIMVLERIGSPEAQSVLENLVRGATGARETEEARASLERLVSRTSHN